MSDDDKVIGPHAGGCWYCGKRAPVDDLRFTWEFDAYVHIQCATRAYRIKGADDTEAYLIYKDVVPEELREPTTDQPSGGADGL